VFDACWPQWWKRGLPTSLQGAVFEVLRSLTMILMAKRHPQLTSKKLEMCQRERRLALAAVDPRIYNMNLCSTAFAAVDGPKNRLPMLAHAHVHEQHFSSVFINMKLLIVEHMTSHRRGPGDQVTMLVQAHLHERTYPHSLSNFQTDCGTPMTSRIRAVHLHGFGHRGKDGHCARTDDSEGLKTLHSAPLLSRASKLSGIT
jgi:hypothetical protein